MAKQILTNVGIFAGGLDLTGFSNKVEIGAEVEEKDVTTFASVDVNGRIWKEVIGGDQNGKVAVSGTWEAADPSKVDDATWAGMGLVDAWTISELRTVGSTAYLTKALRSAYNLGGGEGDVAPWTGGATESGAVARGTLLHPPGTARTATGNGTAVQLGAVAAGRVAYATLHVLSVSGTTPSITATIQSDDNGAFSSPVTRFTFAAANTVGGQFLGPVAGPVTDDWWRVTWTITGTTPSFLFVAAVGFVNA